MSNITEIKTSAHQSTEEIIEYLEEYIKLAKDGEFIGIAIAAVCKNRAIRTAISSSDNAPALLGGLVIAQNRLLSVMDGKPE